MFKEISYHQIVAILPYNALSRYREPSNFRKYAIFWNKTNERFKLTSRTFGDKWRARELVILR